MIHKCLCQVMLCLNVWILASLHLCKEPKTCNILFQIDCLCDYSSYIHAKTTTTLYTTVVKKCIQIVQSLSVSLWLSYYKIQIQIQIYIAPNSLIKRDRGADETEAMDVFDRPEKVNGFLHVRLPWLLKKFPQAVLTLGTFLNAYQNLTGRVW